MKMPRKKKRKVSARSARFSSTLDSFLSKMDKSITSDIDATYNKATGWLAVKFPGKPSSDVLSNLKALGFGWRPGRKQWVGKWTASREDHLKGLTGGRLRKLNIKPNWGLKSVNALERANKHLLESDERFNRAHKIMDAIPFGQPILVGHHSERRHRSDLRKVSKHEEIGRREQEIGEKLTRRAERYRQKAKGEDPGLLSRRIEKLEAEERGWIRSIAEAKLKKAPKEQARCQRHLEFTRERLKIERAKYKASGGIPTDKLTLKPGDRVDTRWGKATIKTVSKRTARVAFDDWKTSLYGMNTDSKIDLDAIQKKLPADKKFVFVKIKKRAQLTPYIGKQVTIAGKQHTHHGCEVYGTCGFSKRGKIVKVGSKLFFIEKDRKTKKEVKTGKITMGRREKGESGLHVEEVRPTW